MACTGLPLLESAMQGKVDFKTTPWPQLSDAAKDCVKELLCKDPAKRPTTAQILQASSHLDGLYLGNY